MEQRNPLDLMLIRFRRTEPEPDKTDPGWGAFEDSLRESGVREPLDITNDGQVIHGRRRWLAACALKLAAVPILVREEAEAPIIYVESLMLREHLTKEVAFFKSIPCLEHFIKSSNDRSLKNLKKGPVFPSGRTAHSETIKTLCMKLGLSWEQYNRTVRVWNLFYNPDCRVLADFYRTTNLPCPPLDRLRKMQAEFKADLEARFLCGEKSAWNVLSFVGGALPELQDKKALNQAQLQLEFWNSPFESLKKAAPAWRKLSTEKRDEVLDQWEATMEAMPADMSAAFLERLERVVA